MKRKECPYCGSEKLDYYLEFGLYKCLGCGNSFNEYEAQYEDIRHELSKLIKDVTEDKPFECRITIAEEYDEPIIIVGIYKDRYGLINFKLCHIENDVCLSDAMFDDFTMKDVKIILDNVKKIISSNERIMKAIMYAIANSTHEDGVLINGVTESEAIDWLEKQCK